MSINPNWPDEKPKKAGMSKTAKVLLWLFGGFVVLGLICCGVVGFIFYSRMSTDPKVIAEKTQEIVDFQVPPEFVPTLAMNLMPLMTIVVYEKPQGELTIAGFGSMLEDQNKQELEAQMKVQLKGQRKGGGKELVIEERQSHTFTIHGQETEFDFAKAKDPDSGKEMWQVSGAFQGKSGVAFLMLKVGRDQYTEEELKELIGEIK